MLHVEKTKAGLCANRQKGPRLDNQTLNYYFPTLNKQLYN
jgi:hypothetical protein